MVRVCAPPPTFLKQSTMPLTSGEKPPGYRGRKQQQHAVGGVENLALKLRRPVVGCIWHGSNQHL
jgi:hypothetical protein